MKKLIVFTLGISLLCSSTMVFAANTGGLLSQPTFRRLTDINEFMAEKNYDEALAVANELLANVQGDDYEAAVVLRQIAYIYIYKEDYPTGLRYLEQALAKKAFGEAEEQSATIALAQLYLTEDKYQKVIELLNGYLKSGKELPPKAYILAAISYSSLNQYKQALPYAKKAVELSEEPRKDWHKLLLAIYFELHEYRNAADLLEVMIAYWPDEVEFWRNLASIYLELKEDAKALATLALAYEQDMLESEQNLLNLSRLYILYDAPYKAGKVVSTGIADKQIEATVKNLELLATAWTQAREYELAVEVLGEAGGKADDGEFYLQQARLYATMHQWDGVVTAVDNAMKKGSLEKPGTAYILQGMAAVEEDEFDKALKAFTQAQKYEDSKEQAGEWIAYVRTDLMRVAQAGN